MRTNSSSVADAETHIVPSSRGIVQGYNAQAAVDTETHLIVPEHVSEHTTSPSTAPLSLPLPGARSGHESRNVTRAR